MSFLELLSQRKEQIKECESQIEALKKEYPNKIHQEDKYRLIKSLKEKKELLNSLNGEEDLEILTKELDKLNERIRRQYFMLKQMLKQSILDDQDSAKEKRLVKEFKNFELDRFDNWLFETSKKILLFFINHPLISIFMFYIIGGGLFLYYFVSLDYYPNMNKESFLYNSLRFAFSTFFIIVILGFSIVVVASSFKVGFKNNKLVFTISQFFFLMFPIILVCLYFKLDKFKIFYIVILAIWLIIYFVLTIKQEGVNLKNSLLKFFDNLFAMIRPLLLIIIILLLAFYIREKSGLESGWIFLMYSAFFIIIGFILKNRPSTIFPISMIVACIITIYNLMPYAIKLAGLGNYTIPTLVVDSKAYIPESFIYQIWRQFYY